MRPQTSAPPAQPRSPPPNWESPKNPAFIPKTKPTSEDLSSFKPSRAGKGLVLAGSILLSPELSFLTTIKY